MILVKSYPEIEALLATTSDAQLKEEMAAMEAFNDELKKAGVLKDADGLRLTHEGKRVRFDGTSRTVVDGPFTGDLVAGYWLWELPSTGEAVRGSGAARTPCRCRRRSRFGRSKPLRSANGCCFRSVGQRASRDRALAATRRT